MCQRKAGNFLKVDGIALDVLPDLKTPQLFKGREVHILETGWRFKTSELEAGAVLFLVGLRLGVHYTGLKCVALLVQLVDHVVPCFLEVEPALGDLCHLRFKPNTAILRVPVV